jgi:glycosyltransferase involved in cell wall biosynthesis
MDCLICPPAGGWECGAALCAAFASGKPVLASRTEDIPEYFARGASGFLYTANHPVELAEAMRAQTLTPAPTLQMRLAQCEKFASESATAVSCKLISRVYREFLDRE